MKAFITVIGHDTVGVVARVSGLCCELNINIEDVTQSILQGMFAMIMLVDISKCSISHEELHQKMDARPLRWGCRSASPARKFSTRCTRFNLSVSAYALPLPGCGTQHPQRSACVLLAAAPTATPCFRHWRRSSLLLLPRGGFGIS